MRLPVPLGRALPLMACLASLGVFSPAAKLTAAASPAALPPVLTVAPSDWLGLINVYREAAGLPAATDNVSWDQGILNHLKYMALTPGALTGYAHSEDPTSPYYTASGALEASRSDLWIGADFSSPDQAIDGWLNAPFHAEGAMRPGLQQTAFAMSTKYPGAGLDVLGGYNYALQSSFYSTSSTPVLFPGPGMSTNLSSFGGESPTPLQTCGWTNLATSVGLPLFLDLPGAVPQGVSASLVLPNGSSESSAGGTLCVVDQYTYTSTDPLYGPTGQEILASDNMIILIPRRSLAPGSYSVDVSLPGQPNVTWGFNELPVVRVKTVSEPQPLIPEGGVASPVQVLVSQGGQPLAGVPVQFSISSGDASFSGSAQVAQTLTDTQGIATTPALVGGATPGNVAIDENVSSEPNGWTTYARVVSNLPDLTTSIAGPPIVRRGSAVTESVEVSNTGFSTAQDVTLSLTLPVGRWRVLSDQSGKRLKGEIVWHLGSLTAGTSIEKTVLFRAPTIRTSGRLVVSASNQGGVSGIAKSTKYFFIRTY